VILAEPFEGRTAHGPDASIRPGAATSRDVSAGGGTSLFHRRPDPEGSDGSALTAQTPLSGLSVALGVNESRPLPSMWSDIVIPPSIGGSTIASRAPPR
jgi:hypothetical protein